jgi:protoporphyrinogen oxidase
MAKIVIIGAGPTGLSAAYHLEKKGYSDYALFEKETAVGGLCRSVHQDGFTFDLTGHLLHVSDPYFKQFIDEVVGLTNLHTVARRSFIYSHGRYTRYPFQINLFGLPEEVIAECIEGYVLRPKIRSPKTFPEWAVAQFGKGIAKHFFLSFQRKIFAYDLAKISAAWTGRFVPSTSLRQIIRGAITDHQDALVGYNAQFYYPKQGGTAFWVNKLANRLRGQLHTDCAVKSIDIKNKVVLFHNGHTEPYEQLITTMPLDNLLACLKGTSSTFLQGAVDKLLCNQVINFNLGIARPNVSDKHWIYYPEKQFPFYRMGFYHNFSASTVPEGCSSLYGEFAHMGSSSTAIARTLNRSLKEAKRLFNIADHEIATQAVIPIKHAYVIYDAWREKNLPAIHARLAEHNIYSVGRYGEWKYSSMQEAVLDGKKIAEKLVIIPAQQAFYVPGATSDKQLEVG